MWSAKTKIDIGKKLLNNREVIVSSILVVSAIVCLFLYSKKNSKQITTEKYWSEDINSFCINKSCFEKQGENWWLIKDGELIPAKNDWANNLIKRMSLLKLDQPASVNTDKYPDFGIDGSVVLTTSGKSLEMGNLSDDLATTFVKVPSQNDVYRTNTIIDKKSLVDINNWENHRVVDLTLNQIKKATLNGVKGNTTIDLIKNRNWLDKLLNLEAKTVTTKVNSSIRGYVFTLTTNDNRDIKFIVSNEWITTDNKYFYIIDRQTYAWLTKIVK